MVESMSDTPPKTRTLSFKAETQQLLNILIHSLYTEREVFLRELISNAADALTRMHFILLTDRDVLDPEVELTITIIPEPEKRILRIIDTGVGMTADEMIKNLGTIAHSGARAFIQTLKESNANPNDIIGQFGVGFYSAFMVAERVEVISRSYKPQASSARWISTGHETFSIEPCEKINRGTEVILYLKEDAVEFTQEMRLRQIIKKHSEYIPYPIYLGEDKEPINRQSALWRQSPQQVKREDYEAFYKQFTLDFHSPLFHLHLIIDAPVQVYALLYIPASPERGPLSARNEEGLKLYARKVLIQEFNRDLLPSFFRFVDGVVDSEDLPLNVSRESVQATRILAQLKRVLTNKLIEALKNWAKEKPDQYAIFWQRFGRFIREGIASDEEYGQLLAPLLRFPTLFKPDQWLALEDYILTMPARQKKIYYLLSDSLSSALNSPHLEIYRRHRYDVLLMTDPLDPFMMLRLKKYQNFELANAASEELPPLDTPSEEQDRDLSLLSEEEQNRLIARFKSILAEKVADVRLTQRLSESPARLALPQDSPSQEIQRVYRLLQSDFSFPKPILEINPHHPLIRNLSTLPDEDPLLRLGIEQIFESALLLEGLLANPGEMVKRTEEILLYALRSKSAQE
ncbi:molecular chaperone HtpG [uncultured Thermanaerothrix sp.]|uniref:molecular chaperone HtpG n=1 Tax=uncultured Thermanaerothrix sp. TaxID=1195149 RepID=UPI00261AB0BA|nr:molecular chaperone HtpG [uncultured Thermanaerothrix sp.]